MAPKIIPAVLRHTPEMLWHSTLDEASRRLDASCEACHRIELMAFDQGALVGFCVLVAEEDANVGPCLGVMWNFVLPEYRGHVGRHFIRRALRIARQSGLRCIAYTHRLGEGRYEITYRRIHG